MSVVLKVQLGATPVVMFHTHNATMSLQLFVEVLAVSSNSDFQSLFSLEVVSKGSWWDWLRGSWPSEENACPLLHVGLPH